MIDFAALQNYVYSDRIYDSEIHGLDHWRQVEFDGLLLAPRGNDPHAGFAISDGPEGKLREVVILLLCFQPVGEKVIVNPVAARFLCNELLCEQAL